MVDIAYQLVLASASPRRAELLQQIGINYLLHPVDIDETVHAGESPPDFVLRLALEKALCAKKDMEQQSINLPVLGSDTVVVINGEVLGKPQNAEHAVQMLTKLSGKKHKVHTAVAIVSQENEFSEVSTSVVEFTELDDETIHNYISTGEPLDKAGAYAIQGQAAQFIKSIEGSYSSIMGLPLFETANMLAMFGVNTLRNSG